MNMANNQHDEQEFDYQADFARQGDTTRERKAPSSATKQRFQYSRTNRSATSHNGIHRRRNKRFSW